MTKKEIAIICMEWKHRIDETIKMSDWMDLVFDYDYDIEEIEELARELYKEWSLKQFGEVDTTEDF